MTEFQKHIRVDMPHLECRRNFYVSLYGSKKLSILAAVEFERYAKSVVLDFDMMNRQPKQRKDLLNAHSVGPEYSKKAIRIQRVALGRALSDGESTLMEQEIVDHVWKKIHKEDVLSKTSVQHSKPLAKFVVDFTGSNQKLQQTCKTLQFAADWAVGMEREEKDHGWRKGQGR